MARAEERVAYLEGQVSELSEGLSDVRSGIRRLEERMDALDSKMSHQFMWLMGIQVTTLVTVVAALISRG